MAAKAEKQKDAKSSLIANPVAQKKNSRKDSAFVDNRPETVAQLKLQELANDHSTQQKPIQKKAAMSGEVIQKGGQLGKMRRTAMESMSPPTEVPTGGMWLVETEAAGGRHQQIRIGENYHSATAVSFGHTGQGGSLSQAASKDTAVGGEGNGVVYTDTSKPTRQIQHTPMTAAQRDRARQLLLGLVGQTAPYDLLANNCAHWSMRHYDDIKAKVKKE